MSEKALVQRILELCDESIYLSESTNGLQRDIAENCWSIAASRKECDEVTVQELEAALNKVIACQREQVAARADAFGAIFYCWFDAQACQFRLCVISGQHEKLPFGCAVRIISSAEPILAAFLAPSFREGLPWQALEETKFSDPVERPTELEAFAIRLP